MLTSEQSNPPTNFTVLSSTDVPVRRKYLFVSEKEDSLSSSRQIMRPCGKCFYEHIRSSWQMPGYTSLGVVSEVRYEGQRRRALRGIKPMCPRKV